MLEKNPLTGEQSANCLKIMKVKLMMANNHMENFVVTVYCDVMALKILCE